MDKVVKDVYFPIIRMLLSARNPLKQTPKYALLQLVHVNVGYKNKILLILLFINAGIRTDFKVVAKDSRKSKYSEEVIIKVQVGGR